MYLVSEGMITAGQSGKLIFAGYSACYSEQPVIEVEEVDNVWLLPDELIEVSEFDDTDKQDIEVALSD